MKRLIFLLYLFLSVSFLYAQPGVKISGKVSDVTGGLPGVSVAIKGTSLGVVTDANGDYSIQAPNQATLVFSFVGYKSQEVLVNNRTSINIKLEENVVGLGEVVIVGYGTQRKIDVTGSVARLKGRKLQSRLQLIQSALCKVKLPVFRLPVVASQAPHRKSRSGVSEQFTVAPLLCMLSTEYGLMTSTF